MALAIVTAPRPKRLLSASIALINWASSRGKLQKHDTCLHVVEPGALSNVARALRAYRLMRRPRTMNRELLAAAAPKWIEIQHFLAQTKHSILAQWIGAIIDAIEADHDEPNT
jgi:hypothetical protein